eukprot:TRINITY_DN20947_c0_g1_i5.p1 TRINITY_DN20947_c0_g1~~TRINITY_DN20947_c0_g1_i5.p1  ORF type:complete len:469 (+),score=85.02 TRINITY_DN20947_c0_g1_i5:70-1476(+)
MLRSRERGLPDHPGRLRLATLALSKGGAAAWDPLPQGFALGSGPTIVSASGPVSTNSEDVAFAAAAARNDLEAVVSLLPRVSSPNVVTRGTNDNGLVTQATTRATTALHLAASQGSVDMVRLLLDARADPTRRQSGLRMLTPLHEAATVEVAEALLASGASPSSTDPREPDPAWYLALRGRPTVAEVVTNAAAAERAQRRQQLGALGVYGSPTAARGGDYSAGLARRAPVIPSMSAAEVAAARLAWSTSGRCLLAACSLQKPRPGTASALGHHRQEGAPPPALLVGSEPCDDAAQTAAADDLDCAICMASLREGDDCMLLPCGVSKAAAAAPLVSETPAMPQGAAGRPHAFHTACLERWWAKSSQCPTCRRDVRQWLPAAAPAPVSAGHPPGSSPARDPAVRRSHSAMAAPLLLGNAGAGVARTATSPARGAAASVRQSLQSGAGSGCGAGGPASGGPTGTTRQYRRT